MDAGEPRLRELRGREPAALQPLEQVGKELRALMRQRRRCALANSAVDGDVGLLGRRTVGSAVNRLSSRMRTTSASEPTGHRLRVVRALVRDVEKGAAFPPSPECRQPTRPRSRTISKSSLVAEVMGGIEPAGGYVLELLAAGKRSSRRTSSSSPSGGAGSSQQPAEAGVRLRFEASVCAAIPVIKVLRGSARGDERPPRAGDRERHDELHPHAEMEGGATLARRARPGAAPRVRPEADPTDDVSGADAAAKMAISPRWPSVRGRRWTTSTGEGSRITPAHVAAGRELRDGREVGRDGDARRRQARRPCVLRSLTRNTRSPPSRAPSTRSHARRGRDPRRSRSRSFRRRRTRAASAVVADMVSIVGTTATGFLQNDACWRTLEAAPGRRHAFALLRASRWTTGPACWPTSRGAWPPTTSRSHALVQAPAESGVLHIVVHEAPQRALDDALAEVVQLPQVHARRRCCPSSRTAVSPSSGWA